MDSRLQALTGNWRLRALTGDWRLRALTGNWRLRALTGDWREEASCSGRTATFNSSIPLNVDYEKIFFVICNFIEVQQLPLNCDLETKTFRRSKIHLPQSPIFMFLLFGGCLKLYVNNCHILDKGYKISKFYAWTQSWFRAASTL